MIVLRTVQRSEGRPAKGPESRHGIPLTEQELPETLGLDAAKMGPQIGPVSEIGRTSRIEPGKHPQPTPRRRPAEPVAPLRNDPAAKLRTQQQTLSADRGREAIRHPAKTHNFHRHKLSKKRQQKTPDRKRRPPARHQRADNDGKDRKRKFENL